MTHSFPFSPFSRVVRFSTGHMLFNQSTAHGRAYFPTGRKYTYSVHYVAMLRQADLRQSMRRMTPSSSGRVL